LIQAGLNSPTDIAQELGGAKGTVSKAAKRLVDKKLIEKNGRRLNKPHAFMKNEELLSGG
jgi:DNA-binding MarR family transcriptional regulator